MQAPFGALFVWVATMAKRKSYDDQFRASAVVMLEAAGYPEREGALSYVAGHIGVPISTLRGWFNASHNPPPAELRNKKRLDLREAVRAELDNVFAAMEGVRQDASYRDLVTAAGILVDKLQLLEGKPTERSEQNVSVSMTDEERAARITAILERARQGRARQSAHYDD